MRKEVKNEIYCPNCGHIEETEERFIGFCCDKCESPVVNNRYIDCDCGTRVYLDENTNECEGCGRLWNRFGQSLKPRNEWEEEY